MTIPNFSMSSGQRERDTLDLRATGDGTVESEFLDCDS